MMAITWHDVKQNSWTQCLCCFPRCAVAQDLSHSTNSRHPLLYEEGEIHKTKQVENWWKTNLTSLRCNLRLLVIDDTLKYQQHKALDFSMFSFWDQMTGAPGGQGVKKGGQYTVKSAVSQQHTYCFQNLNSLLPFHQNCMSSFYICRWTNVHFKIYSFQVGSLCAQPRFSLVRN